MLKIPAAVAEPTCFQSQSYIRINSHKTDLKNFSDLIRQIYNSHKDWSAEIMENASLDDLDPSALVLAREKFIERNPNSSQLYCLSGLSEKL